MARSTVFGDPTEYTYVASFLGVAHPPGYAFITLVGKLFQTLIPFGEPSWRMHLVGVTAGTIGALCVFSMVQRVMGDGIVGTRLTVSLFAGLFGALLVATGADYWQHSIHANPHIMTCAFVAFYLYALTRWAIPSPNPSQREGSKLPPPHRGGLRGGIESKGRNGWLYACCFAAGLGVTHHPLTVFAVPACAVFILLVRPRILLEWRTLLAIIGCGLAGLLIWLYFPLRAAALADTQFDHSMNTLDGFLDIILARGLTGNLWAFGWTAQAQWQRWLAFWSLLRVQYAPPIALLAAVGIVGLLRHNWRLFILYFGAWLSLYLFVINTVQDVMAYLLTPFLLVGLFAALGLGELLRLMLPIGATHVSPLRQQIAYVLVIVTFLIGPLWQTINHLPHISLREFSTGQDYVTTLHEMFDGSGENAIILSDWEYLTQVDYARLVLGDSFDEDDITPKLVVARSDYNPAEDAPLWVDNVFQTLPGHPVFLTRFERSVFDIGFRVRQRGIIQQVVNPGDASIPPEISILTMQGDGIDLVGYHLPKTDVEAGEYVRLTLATRIPITTTDIYMPVLSVGETVYNFTTDSHLLTRDYRPGEVIVEAYDFALPHDVLTGDYPVTVSIKNLTGAADTNIENIQLGTLTVAGKRRPPNTKNLLANFRQQIGLASATIRHEQRFDAPWQPISARPSDTFDLTLNWRVIDVPTDSYTVFVHLIDGANRPYNIGELDGTPLGGAAPTYLWFPKWLPGQLYRDPYTFTLTDIPPGQYSIEVGLYEQFTQRRLHIHDSDGNVMGNDRIILGNIIVNE